MFMNLNNFNFFVVKAIIVLKYSFLELVLKFLKKNNFFCLMI